MFTAVTWDDVGVLLRAERHNLEGWVKGCRPVRLLWCSVIVLLGAGLYGAVMGSWRDPLQALYTGIKLPLVILLTTFGNALLNAMLAPLLGINLTFRQSFLVVLLTFTIAAVLLAAFSPIAGFMLWNTPPLTAATRLDSVEYGFMQLMLVAFITFAGVTGNTCLEPLLRQWSGSATAARKVLLAWLAVNLLLGSQISWVLRPFIWDPARPVEFLGPEHLRGSFYETVFEAVRRLIMS
jgi:hypothetical protein